MKMNQQTYNILDEKLHNNELHIIDTINEYICYNSVCQQLNEDNCRCNSSCGNCGNKFPNILTSCQTCQEYIDYLNNEIKGTDEEEFYLEDFQNMKSSDMCNKCCGLIGCCYICGKTEIYCQDRCSEYVYDISPDNLFRPDLNLIEGCLMCDQYVCYDCTYEINDDCRICQNCK